MLIFTVPITTVADDNFYFYLFFKIFFRENNSWHFMWIVCKQMIHMKYQDLFSLKNNNKSKF